MMNEFLFLGSGGSTGIPVIGCTCPVCTSLDPHNKRLRPSGVVVLGKKRVLIDAGPDFRFQALRYHLDDLDGVLITHTHFDHIAGLDELRTYNIIHKKRLPVLVSEPSYRELQKRYDYLFHEKNTFQSYTAQLDFQILEGERGEVNFLDIPIGYMSYEQGGMQVNGYRFGTFAYISDICHYPETIFEDLKGVRILVVSALMRRTSPMHLNLDEAVEFSRKVGAKETYFTHMNHELDHAETNASLPEGFQLAYDGLKLKFS